MNKPIFKIGYLQITDHLILGISNTLDKKRFINFNLEPVRYDSWFDLMQALRTGDIDGAFIIATLAMELKAKDKINLKTLLLGHREGLGLVLNKKIKNVAGLKGKTIGIPHELSTHNILLKKLLYDEGIDPFSVKVKEIDPSEFVSRLSKGEIDGYFGSEPFGSQAEDQFIGKIFKLSKEIKRNHIDCVLVVREKLINNNREAIKEFIESLVRAGRLIHSRPKVASEIGAKFLNQSKKVIFKVLAPKKGHLTAWDLAPIADEFSDLQKLGNKFNVLKSNVNVDEFIDSTFAKEAYTVLAENKIKQKNIVENLKTFFYPLGFFIVFFLVWELFSKWGIISNQIMPAPSEVMKALKETWINGTLMQNSLASLYRVFMGFFLSTILAIPLGLIIGSKKYLNLIFNPFIQVVRTISPISWIPLAILWFGVGNKPAIFIIFITAFFPTLLSTMLAVKNVDPVLIRVANNFGAKGNNLIFKVVLPAIFPYIIIGLRISLGISWVIVVAAEMVGMSSGLGYMILDARNFLRTDLIIAGMLVIGLIGFILDLLLGYLEKQAKLAWGLIK